MQNQLSRCAAWRDVEKPAGSLACYLRAREVLPRLSCGENVGTEAEGC